MEKNNWDHQSETCTNLCDFLLTGGASKDKKKITHWHCRNKISLQQLEQTYENNKIYYSGEQQQHCSKTELIHVSALPLGLSLLPGVSNCPRFTVCGHGV